MYSTMPAFILPIFSTYLSETSRMVLPTYIRPITRNAIAKIANTTRANLQSTVNMYPTRISGNSMAVTMSGIWWAINNSIRSTSSLIIFFSSPEARRLKNPKGKCTIFCANCIRISYRMLKAAMCESIRDTKVSTPNAKKAPRAI